LDSGYTAHLLIANAHCKKKLLAQSPLEVLLKNGAVFALTYTANLDLLSLPMASRQADILPGLDQRSLFYVGQMYFNWRM
jgi:hypothetical protein